ILDTVLVNCVIIYCKAANSNISSKDFRINLAWDLIRDTLDDGKKKELQDLQALSKGKRIIVNKNFELLLTHL
ncbi:4138_t:CDS:1, partial [Dentiscutata heterogama]